MKLRMKHLALFLLLAFAFACAGLGVSVNAAASASGTRAGAETAEDGTMSEQAALFLPSSYEQHLALKNPVDMAFSENHIAIADGKTLYLYDNSAKSYSSSVIPDEGDDSTITKVGFSGDKLFVSVRAASNSFYEYDFSTHTFKKLTINCTTFYINNGTLYTANVGGAQTNIASYSVSDLTSGNTPATKSLGTIDQHTTPSITMLGKILYCTFDDRVYRIDPSIGTFANATPFYLSSAPSDTSNVQSTCIHENVFYYTSSNGLYRNEFATDQTPTKATCVLEGTGYGALTSFDGKLYAVKGSSIIEIGFEDFQASLTGYEISASSASVGRLSGAVDTARAGDLLVTADAGNRRVSVTTLVRTESGLVGADTFVIPCRNESGEPFAPTHVATDGSVIAVSGDDFYIYLYDRATAKEGGGYTLRYSAQGNPVTGLTCVYGNVYFVTEHNYGKAEEGSELVQRNNGKTNAALTSDVYGNLYVVCGDRTVIKFPESGFLDSKNMGETLSYRLPERFTSLHADFEGNLYCLFGNSLLKNGEHILFTVNGSDYVYTMSAGAPLAFTLGYEDDEVFFLYGDFLVKTRPGVLDIPTLSKISAEGVQGDVFRPHGEEALLIDIPAGTIAVRTDLAQFQTDAPAYFPYLAYYRTAEDKRGILLSVKDRYALVILYEVGESDRTFEADLFLLETAQVVPTGEYFREAKETLYLSSDVSAYFYPCLHAALTDTRLTRGTSVWVRGYVTAPEREYALVEFGEERTAGFVPASYLTAVDPLPGEKTVFEPAYLKASAEGVEFTADDGTVLVVTERTRTEISDNGDGTYTARIMQGGKEYRATVRENMIDRGESDAVRIALIVILTALGVGIIGGYVYLLPRKTAPGKYEEFK